MARVLVVDDSPSVREMVSALLVSLGHQTHHASDGVEALEEVEKRVFDAVITDYHMPNMDGIELIRELRKLARFKSKPILVLSTEMDPGVKQAAKDAGATGFGHKPLDVERFESLIQRLLG